MDEQIKNSINVRKSSIYDYYDLNDAMNGKVEEYFKRVEEFAKDCKDVADFETKFQASPLSQEYMGLFTELATTCSPKGAMKAQAEAFKERDFKQDMKEELEYQMKDATMPARRMAREQMDRQLRSTPILGDAIQAKQTFDLFGKFRRKKNDDNIE